MPEDPDPNQDLKAKMREALDRKKAHGGINPAGQAKEKAHGSEVAGAAGPEDAPAQGGRRGQLTGEMSHALLTGSAWDGHDVPHAVRTQL